MSESPLISVVTPVYNGAEYLEECLSSVLSQSYSNWRVAIIDNASTDATPAIAARFAAQDSRIRHLRFDEFVDAAENHNRAFRSVDDDAEFCKVLQADDWLYSNCLELMVDAARADPTVGIVSAYQLFGDEVRLQGLPYTTTFVEGREILRRTLAGRFNVTGSPTALLIRSDLVRSRDPFYQEGFWHDDTEAALWLLTQSDFAFVHQILTFARRQAGSRLAHARWLNAEGAEQIQFLLRYGPDVMEPDEYRNRLRRVLRDYRRYHMKKLARLSLLGETEFFEFHHAHATAIAREGAGDPEVRSSMTFVKTLLLRQALGAPWRHLRSASGSSGRLLDAL